MKKALVLWGLLSVCLLSALGLSGCGNTGSLYMPEEPSQSEKS